MQKKTNVCIIRTVNTKINIFNNDIKIFNISIDISKNPLYYVFIFYR